MNILQQTIKIINAGPGIIMRILSTNLVIKNLKNDPDDDIKKMAGILRFQYKSNTWTEKEMETLAKINTIRTACHKSKELLTVKEYGAGKAGNIRSKVLMEKGINKIVTVADIYKKASTKRKWGQFIFKIIREFKPNICLELGTCLGISTLYLIGAFTVNQKGNITTIEGEKEFARLAEKNLQQIKYPHFAIKIGRFSEVLHNILSEIQNIDFVYIDGHHNKEATKKYFKQLYPFMSQQAICIIDDINWSKGMKEAWQDIYQDKKVKASFDLYQMGICLIDKAYINKELKHYKLFV